MKNIYEFKIQQFKQAKKIQKYLSILSRGFQNTSTSIVVKLKREKYCGDRVEVGFVSRVFPDILSYILNCFRAP